MPLSNAHTHHSTPCQVRVQRTSNTLKSSELHLLQAELRDHVVENMDFQLFVRNVLKLSDANMESLTRLHRENSLGSALDWDRFLERVSISGSDRESAIYDPLIDLVHWIQSLVEGSLPRRPGATGLRFCNTSFRALGGSPACRKPDITAVSAPHTSYPDWKKALIVWEVKHNCKLAPALLLPVTYEPRPFASENSGLTLASKKRAAPAESLPFPPRKKSKSNSTSQNEVENPNALADNDRNSKLESPLEQLLSYTLEAMVAQPHRRHAIGLLLQDFRLQVVFHCRSVVVTSEPFDIRVRRDQLIIVIAALCTADLETLGLEKRFIGPGGRPALDPIGSSVSIDGMDLEIKRTIYKARSLLGRGSAALVGADKKSPTKLYVIKISCQAKTRELESSFLEAATDVPNIIRLKCSANWGCMLEGFERKFLSAIGEVEPREFRVLVISPVCELISIIEDLSIFKMCFIKLVKAHRALFEKYVLHCDISIWNLMYDPISREPYLIDADLGKSVTKLGAPSSNHRTGTLPFMAIDLLVRNPPPHIYRHDLESFYYVLVWICAEDHLGWDLVGSVDRMAKEKSYFMLTFDFEVLHVKKFPELKASWLTKLHQMFGFGVLAKSMRIKGDRSSPFDEETLGGRVTYELFLEAIGA